ELHPGPGDVRLGTHLRRSTGEVVQHERGLLDQALGVVATGEQSLPAQEADPLLHPRRPDEIGGERQGSLPGEAAGRSVRGPVTGRGPEHGGEDRLQSTDAGSLTEPVVEVAEVRSEERRVGKEGRRRQWRNMRNKKKKNRV